MNELNELEKICLSKIKDNNEIKTNRLKSEIGYLNNDQAEFFIFLYKLLTNNDDLLVYTSGRSTNSYILFLLGINKIDPLKYNLNEKLFYKELSNSGDINFTLISNLKEKTEIKHGAHTCTLMSDDRVILLSSFSNDFAKAEFNDDFYKKLNEGFVVNVQGHKINTIGEGIYRGLDFLLEIGDINNFDDLIHALALFKGTDVFESRNYMDADITDSNGKDVHHNLLDTQDDLYSYYLKHGVPEDVALAYISPSFLKKPLSPEIKHDLFEKYNINEDMVKFINKISYLPPMGSAISDSDITLKLLYQKFNNPNKFYKTILKKYKDVNMNNITLSLLADDNQHELDGHLLFLEQNYRKTNDNLN